MSRESSLRCRSSNRIRPDQGSCRPAIRRAIVDLPLPEDPTSAIRSPGASSSEKSSISGAVSGL